MIFSLEQLWQLQQQQQRLYLWSWFIVPVPFVVFYGAFFLSEKSGGHCGARPNSARSWKEGGFVCLCADAILAYVTLAGIQDEGRNLLFFKRIVRARFLATFFLRAMILAIAANPKRWGAATPKKKTSLFYRKGMSIYTSVALVVNGAALVAWALRND
jgi:hypothetical protein